MPAEEVRAAARPRAARGPGGRALLRPGLGLPAAARLDRRAARRRARPRGGRQRLARGGDHAVRPPGRAGRPGRSSRRRPTTARCSRCERAAPSCRRPARGRRDRRGRAGGRAGGWAASRASRTRSPTSTTPPAARSRRRSASGCWSSPREHDFVIFEDDPYREVRFEGEDLPTMLSLDTDESVVYASSFSKTIAPGRARRLPDRPRGPDRRAHQARGQHLHLAEHARAGDRRRVLPLRRDRALDRRRSSGRCASAATRVAEGAAGAHRRRGALRAARGRLLPVGRAARGRRHRACCWPPPPSAA